MDIPYARENFKQLLKWYTLKTLLEVTLNNEIVYNS